MLMNPLVQIDLPPYTDYASLERKLTFAIECASIPTRGFTFIYTSAVRPLDLVKNRGCLAYLDGFYTPKFLPSVVPWTPVFPVMSLAPASSACIVSH